MTKYNKLMSSMLETPLSLPSDHKIFEASLPIATRVVMPPPDLNLSKIEFDEDKCRNDYVNTNLHKDEIYHTY